MHARSLALLGLLGTSFVLGCDRLPGSEDPMTAVAIIVTGPDSGATGAVAAVHADGGIAGPSAQGGMLGIILQREPMPGLFDPSDPREVTLAPVIGAGRKGRVVPSMTLFGGADQAWRVQVGPRLDLGRNSGLMLRGGTQGQHNRWDLGASATIGERPNVQGVVRFHP